MNNPHDFAESMKTAAEYADNEGFPGALPAFVGANYGDGDRFGLWLIKPEAGERRDVPLRDLMEQEPKLDESRFREQVEERFYATYHYAHARYRPPEETLDGGFPNMFDDRERLILGGPGTKGRVGIVCGTVLLRREYTKAHEILLFQDP